ncbi:MAG TPA: hypothetical protein VD886_01965 [Herpetosiphonaceae bacterium]|nr:hypothetical protein [Herpetosiphonaceae bacterium]
MIQTYKPSNRVSLIGLIGLALTVLSGGVALGIGAGYISRYVWVILLFPLIVGGVAGGMLAFMIKRLHLRNPGVALFAGLLMGTLCFGAFHSIEYMEFRSEMVAAVIKEDPASEPAQIESFIDFSLQEETGSSGIIGYFKLMAREGISLRIGKGNAKLALHGTLAWIYWAIEFLIFIAFPALVALNGADEPYCEQCRRWYGEEAYLGSVQLANTENFLALLQSGASGGAATLLGGASIELPRASVYLRSCRQPGLHASHLSVTKQSLSGKGETYSEPLLSGLISPQIASELRRTNTQPAEGVAGMAQTG